MATRKHWRSIHQAIIQLYFIYKTTRCLKNVDHSTDLHPRMDENELDRSLRPIFEMPTDTITAKRPSGAQLAANLNFDFPQVVRTATYFRCGRISCIGFAYNLLLFSKLKEFWKSIRFWQSYHHQLGGPLFLGTQCRWNSTGCHRRLCLRLLCPLTFWPNQYVWCLISHTWPNFGENGHEDIVFTRFSWAVTLIFDLCSQKLISTSSFSA